MFLLEPSLLNAPAKQQREKRQGKTQPDAIESKQKPAGKAISKRQSQKLKGKHKPPKRQKQNNKRTRMPGEDQKDGLDVLVAAAEFEEVDASSTEVS